MTGSFPPRLIIDDQKTMVILDTVVARELVDLEHCPAWVETFEKMTADGYTFSLADGTFIELVNQRSRGSITADQFQRMCTRLTQFLSTELPIAPGRRDLLGMLQQDGEPWSEQECRSISLDSWAELLRCADAGYTPGSTEHLLEEERNAWRAMLAGFQETVNTLKHSEQLRIEVLHALDEAGLLSAFDTLSEHEFLKALEAIHTLQASPSEEVLDLFKAVPNVALQKVFQSLEALSPQDLSGVLQLAHPYKDQKQHIDDNSKDPTDAWQAWTAQQVSWKVIGPKINVGVTKAFENSESAVFTMNMRSHLEVLYCWTRFSSMQKVKRAYDPTSKKSRNDGVDFDLYRFLKLPAFVVTLDKGFLEGLTDFSSYQANWFFRPQELADSWNAGITPKPRWPAVKDLCKR
jgi:hypothetical protein